MFFLSTVPSSLFDRCVKARLTFICIYKYFVIFIIYSYCGIVNKYECLSFNYHGGSGNHLATRPGLWCTFGKRMTRKIFLLRVNNSDRLLLISCSFQRNLNHFVIRRLTLIRKSLFTRQDMNAHHSSLIKSLAPRNLHLLWSYPPLFRRSATSP